MSGLNNLENKIKSLRKKVDSHNARVERLEGQRQAALEQLHKLGFEDEESARAWVEEAETELTSLKEQLNDDIEEFENEYSNLLG